MHLHVQAMALDVLVPLQVFGHADRVVLRVLQAAGRRLSGDWADHCVDEVLTPKPAQGAGFVGLLHMHYHIMAGMSFCCIRMSGQWDEHSML